MSNPRRWREFMSWWSMKRRQTDWTSIEEMKKDIDEKIEEIKRNDKEDGK